MHVAHAYVQRCMERIHPQQLPELEARTHLDEEL